LGNTDNCQSYCSFVVWLVTSKSAHAGNIPSASQDMQLVK
jgi:hypothetical protein